MNVNVEVEPANRVPSVVAEPDCDLIVLIDDRLVDLVPLRTQEVAIPDSLRQVVPDAH